MADRLTRIVTRGGDKGKTSLADGSRVHKYADRVEAMGTVDELNSVIGFFVATLNENSPFKAIFRQVQNDLFDLGGELSMPGHSIVTEEYWKQLEQWIEELNGNLAPLENFILPGGSQPVAACHIMRSVARRAERRLVALAAVEDMNQQALIYLNRLSDLCFVAARALAQRNGETEILWQQRKPSQ